MRKTLGALLAAAATTIAAFVLITTGTTGASDPSLPPMQVSGAGAEQAVEAIANSSPPEQRTLLLDRGVSLDEYRTAVDEARRCLGDALTAQGVAVEVAEPQLSRDDYEFSYNYRLGPKPDGGLVDPELVSQLDRSCRARFLDATEDVYQLRARADGDFNESVRGLLERCLRQAGIEPEARGDARDLAMSATADAEGAAAELIAVCLIDLPSVTDVVVTEFEEATRP